MLDAGPNSSSITASLPIDRLEIIQTLNSLPLTQFIELEYALNPPPGILSPIQEKQGIRSIELLKWLEGSTGPGLSLLVEILQKCAGISLKISKPNRLSSRQIAFTLSGNIEEIHQQQLLTLVDAIRKITGDQLIEIIRIEKGSIKLILGGTEDGLRRLKEVFKNGLLERIEDFFVEEIDYVGQADFTSETKSGGYRRDVSSHWVQTLFAPAFIFWLGGGLATVQRYGWQEFIDVFLNLTGPLLLVVSALALLIVAVSGIVVQQFEFAVLRLLEGYWPNWCHPLSRWLIKRQRRRFQQIGQRWQDFNRRGLVTLTSEERQDYIEVDLQLSKFPELERLLPMRLGNILRSAEDRCAMKYGLDAIICWPRLWLVLPEEVKAELSVSRNNLNLNARLWLWGGLFLLWSPVFLVWWPLPLGLGSAWLANRWLVQAAQVYGDLLESTFDLYRFALYETLRLPLPSNPSEERALGQGLTKYLWRGSEQSKPQFIKPKE